LIAVEGEEAPLETRFTEAQQASIIQEILKNINRSYTLRNEK
jgi:hypothetical protein